MGPYPSLRSIPRNLVARRASRRREVADYPSGSRQSRTTWFVTRKVDPRPPHRGHPTRRLDRAGCL